MHRPIGIWMRLPKRVRFCCLSKEEVFRELHARYLYAYLQSTILDRCAAHNNGYTELEERFRAVTGIDLLSKDHRWDTRLDPFLTKGVSIITCAYNSDVVTRKFLVSLCNSPCVKSRSVPLEVIVVDDGSTNDSAACLNNLAG
jgi:Glycosyl transferase family 2